MKKYSGWIWFALMAGLIIGGSIFYSNNKSKGKFVESTKNDISSKDVSGEQAGKIMAPDFTLKDLDGKNVKLSDYKGKVVIINFWAVWCKYCVQEMPDLNELNKELEKENDAVILAVDVQEKPELVKDYLNKNNISLHVLLDSDGAISKAYNITGFPTTYIINRDGSVFTYVPGATTKENIKEILGKIK